MDQYKLVWIGNGWRLARATRRIRRGKNKNKVEVKYLQGRRLIKKIVDAGAIREK